MALFYVPNLLESNNLPEEESFHAIKVLRLKEGDNIQVVDGIGGLFNAIITTPHHKHCGFRITDKIANTQHRDYKLHIAIAPTKNIERFEWFIEKATEIGIDEITPLICKNSERKIVKEERLMKVIIAASKQSLKSSFPILHPATDFKSLITKVEADTKFIAHCYDTDKLPLKSAIKPATNSVILIGPEGDFSPDEVENSTQKGFIAVSLGDSRLRTETAGLVACNTFYFVN